jgi:hypothetical protein
LPPGLKQTPPDPTAQSDAVIRIKDAIAQVNAIGLRPIIYTKKSDWRLISGDTSLFKDLPLWHTQTTGGADLTLPDLSDPNFTFGGWGNTDKVGKQYLLDTFLTDPHIQVDLNVFLPSAFSLSNPNYIALDLHATIINSSLKKSLAD